MSGNQKQQSPNPTNNLPKDVMADIRAARAEYQREWRRKNPRRQAEISLRYWKKKAQEMNAENSNDATDSE